MRLRRPLVIAIGFLVLATGAWLAGASRAGCTAIKSVDGIVSVKLSSLRPDAARLFCYNDAGKQLRFVLARGRDGKIRAAFDACRQCYTFHRGYKIEHGELICRVCGNRYPIDHMTEGKASCVPVNLRHEISGDSVTVRKSDLDTGRTLF
jgi:uncharacterized membrane protein